MRIGSAPRPSHVPPFSGFDGLWIGASLLFFIYTGFGALGAAAEEASVHWVGTCWGGGVHKPLWDESFWRRGAGWSQRSCGPRWPGCKIGCDGRNLNLVLRCR